MREIWNFEMSWFFFGKKKILFSPYEYSNKWIGDVIPSQFSTHLLTEMFSHETVLLTPYPPKLNGKLCLFSHTSRQGYALTRFFQKMKNFKISCIIYMTLWGHDITNSLIWIFIRTSQEMFSEFFFSKCHIFLISNPIVIIFAPICRENVSLSS